MTASLHEYHKKRNFSLTGEPAGRSVSFTEFRFVIQRHEASHLHFDFRLELGGVLKSWAVPKGPPEIPTEKRLAIQVEDHPVSYITFEGKIPAGNYGAGKVAIWDHGTFIPVDKTHAPISAQKALKALKAGELKFRLSGKKCKGEYVLVRIKSDTDKNNQWLFLKHDESKSPQPDSAPSQDRLTKPPAGIAIAARSPGRRGSRSEGWGKAVEDYYPPMLASAGRKAFNDPEWIFEIKWDGYRAIAECSPAEVKLYSRNGRSMADKFPTIIRELSGISHQAVIDGEIVVLGTDETPNFQDLQDYDPHSKSSLVYYAFDLLVLDQKDVRHLPLLHRKELLLSLLEKSGLTAIRYHDHVNETGVSFYDLCKKRGLEGIMAKKADSPYHSGARSKAWLKLKNTHSREALIVGFTRSRVKGRAFGAVILAGEENNQLTFIGHTGTGFHEKMVQDLWSRFQPLITAESPFKTTIRGNMPITWVKPMLRCRVHFTEETSSGVLRHPVFERLLTPTDQAVIVSKKVPEITVNSIGMEEERYIHGHRLHLSHLDKVYWPAERITKGQMITYYETISAYILPYLNDRPLSLRRNPNGILDEGFFQKNAASDTPSWIKQVLIPSAAKDIHYLVCNNLESLLYIANLGSIELNPWHSTTEQLDYPTYTILDLDPSPKNTFDEVIQAALVIKELADEVALATYPKTSGATGLHIYIPLDHRYTYEQSRDFTHLLAQITVSNLPEITSIERNIAKRGNKIYVDFLQNARGQTISSVYSLRPKPGATASAPLHWDEVKKGLHPRQFTITSLPERLKDTGDLFKPVLSKGIDLEKVLKKLEAFI